MAISICLTCLRLRGMYEGMEHRCRCQPADDKWRNAWERYDVPALVALCSLCVRATVSSGTRWSWYACDTCRRVNQDVGAVVGGNRSGALPFGRHTLMNGAAVGSAGEGDSEIEEFARTLKGLLREWQRLGEWRKAEARRLADSAMLTFDQAEEVPLDTWLRTFPSSEGASVDAYCRYVGAELPEHPDLRYLTNARLEFVYAL